MLHLTGEVSPVQLSVSSLRVFEPKVQCADVGGVAAAAAADETNAFVIRDFAKVVKLAAGHLDHLQIIGECRQLRERMTLFRGAEGGGLGCQWDRDSIAHLPKQ